MKKVIYSTFIITISIVAIMFNSPMIVSASNLNNNSGVYKKLDTIRSRMEADGIEKGRRDLILQKLSKGETLDSEDPNAKPIKSRLFKQDGFIIDEKIYNDGSYIITKVTDHEKLLEDYSNTRTSWTPSISKGRIVSSTSTHTRVEEAKAIKTSARNYVEFYFDYTTVSEGPCSIDAVYDGYGYPDSLYELYVSTPSIVYQHSNSSRPALAQMNYSYRKTMTSKPQNDILEIRVNRSGARAY